MFKLYTKHDIIIPEQNNYISGVLEFSNKTAENAITPLEKVYMVEESMKITDDFIFEAYKKGFSKIPVYHQKQDNIVGVIYIKDLLIVKTKKDILTVRQVMQIFNRNVHVIDANTPLKEVLKMLKTRSSHVGIVRTIEQPPNSDPIYKIIGVITLEDVIEELLMDEITDSDQAVKGDPNYIAHHDIINFFTDFRAQKQLTPSFIDAIACYLSINCAIFSSIWFSQETLKTLIMNSLVYNIKSDLNPALNKHNQITLMAKDSFHTRAVSLTNSQFNKEKAIEMNEVKLFPKKQSIASGKEVDTISNPVLYERNVQTDVFILVLSGKVDICSGKDGFHSEIDFFHFLGSDAITNDVYFPDFTAKVLGDASILKIKKEDYRKYVAKQG